MTVIAVTSWFNVKHGWLGVPLSIPGLWSFQMMVSGFPSTVVSTEMVRRLPMFFEASGTGRYVMHGVELGGHPLGSLEVRVSAQIWRLDADGAFGLDFLRRFTEITLHMQTSQLTFTSP